MQSKFNLGRYTRKDDDLDFQAQLTGGTANRPVTPYNKTGSDIGPSIFCGLTVWARLMAYN